MLTPDVLFSFAAAAPLTGAAYSRTGAAYRTDRLGRLSEVAANVAGIEWRDEDGDGVLETRYFPLIGTTTNLCPNSEDLSAWTPSTPAPTVTDDAITHGDLALALVEDDSATDIESISQSISFTGDGQKAFSFHVRRPPNPASSGASIQLRDTTAGVDRARLELEWNDDGSPQSGISGAGTLLAFDPRGAGIYRVLMRTASVTAANAHSIIVSPALVAAQTGDLYVGGFQCANRVFNSVYHPTNGGTATRNAEQTDFTSSIPKHQSWTLYLKFRSLNAETNPGEFLDLVGLLDGGSEQILLYRHASSGVYVVGWRQPIEANINSTVFSAGALAAHEVLVRHDASDHHLEIAVNDAAIQAGSAPTSQTLPFQNSFTTLRLRNDAFVLLSKLKVATRLNGWDTMRRLVTPYGK